MAKGVAIVDTDRKTLHVNSTWCDITGYAVGDVVGRADRCPFRLLAGPATDDLALRAIDQAIARGTEVKGEILAYKRDGTEFWNEPVVIPQDHKEQHFSSIESSASLHCTHTQPWAGFSFPRIALRFPI